MTEYAENDSLPKLIERLRDLQGESCLYLDEASLKSIVRYRGVEDFAEMFTEFLDAIKANNTVTELEIGCDTDLDKQVIFPIVNPLFRHLPQLKKVILPVTSNPSLHRFLWNEASSFTNITVDHVETEPDDQLGLELHPDLEVFQYTNWVLECVNGAIGPILLSLPFPSKLRELAFTEDPSRCFDWINEMARPFTGLELNRLVDIVQVSSLVKLTLRHIRLSSMEECSQFARALAASPSKDLCLQLFTPDAGNYRDIVSALSEMPHLESLKAIFALDRWEKNEEIVGSFSVPVGDIVRGVSGMKSLGIEQCWKPWDDVQCRDLAVAIQAPSCGLKALDISGGICDGDFGVCETTTAGAATVLSAFSSPLSTIEVFTVLMAIEENEDCDLWLSRLPRWTTLRSLRICVRCEPAVLTELQQRKFLEIVSGWYYLLRNAGDFYCRCLGEDIRKQLRTLLRLNKAGRHYLTLSTRSKADGVEVLVNVRDELNDIYTHLLENPCLCDRSVDPPSPRRSSRIRKKARGG